MPIKAILTDIEGTTSAVSFVFDVLLWQLADWPREGGELAGHVTVDSFARINPSAL
jgi:hypothetical protein